MLGETPVERVGEIAAVAGWEDEVDVSAVEEMFGSWRDWDGVVDMDLL